MLQFNNTNMYVHEKIQRKLKMYHKLDCESENTFSTPWNADFEITNM